MNHFNLIYQNWPNERCFQVYSGESENISRKNGHGSRTDQSKGEFTCSFARELLRNSVTLICSVIFLLKERNFVNGAGESVIQGRLGMSELTPMLFRSKAIHYVIMNLTVSIFFGKYVLQLSGFGPKLLQEVDPNPENYVCAGIINTKMQQIGTLIRLEPNKQAMVIIFILCSVKNQ